MFNRQNIFRVKNKIDYIHIEVGNLFSVKGQKIKLNLFGDYNLNILYFILNKNV